MKFFTTAALWTVLLSSVGAFAPSAYQCNPITCVSNSQLSATVAAPASSIEEDLMLTLKVILDHVDRSSTLSKEQFIQQEVESKKEVEAEIETIDVSIPYMATAQIAYEQSDKPMPYDKFESKFLANAIQEVIAKQPVDISIPYDSAAQLAYDQSDKSVSFADFKPKYIAKAIEEVIAKQPVDISIPYDSAAQLAYDQSDKSVSFSDFKPKYLAKAIEEVIAKK